MGNNQGKNKKKTEKQQPETVTNDTKGKSHDIADLPPEAIKAPLLDRIEQPTPVITPLKIEEPGPTVVESKPGDIFLFYPQDPTEKPATNVDVYQLKLEKRLIEKVYTFDVPEQFQKGQDELRRKKNMARKKKTRYPPRFPQVGMIPLPEKPNTIGFYVEMKVWIYDVFKAEIVKEIDLAAEGVFMPYRYRYWCLKNGYIVLQSVYHPNDMPMKGSKDCLVTLINLQSDPVKPIKIVFSKGATTLRQILMLSNNTLLVIWVYNTQNEMGTFSVDSGELQVKTSDFEKRTSGNVCSVVEIEYPGAKKDEIFVATSGYGVIKIWNVKPDSIVAVREIKRPFKGDIPDELPIGREYQYCNYLTAVFQNMNKTELCVINYTEKVLEVFDLTKDDEDPVASNSLEDVWSEHSIQPLSNGCVALHSENDPKKGIYDSRCKLLGEMKNKKSGVVEIVLSGQWPKK